MQRQIHLKMQLNRSFNFVLDEPVYDTNRKTAKAQFFYQYAFFTQERERIRLIINN
jgi:hypothetical protein